MQKLIKLALVMTSISITTFSPPSFAVEGLSANVGITNNYLWRGITQTQNKAAVSGGIDYEHQSGITFGAWTSNASWAENITYELDLYASYTGNINEQLSYSLGYIYYDYDSAAQTDFSEIFASLTYQNFTFTYNTLADAQAGGNFADDTYISADAEFSLTPQIGLTVHAGSYTFKNAENYRDYAISLTKDEYTLTLSDTDLTNGNDDLAIQVSYTLAIDL